MAFSLSALFRRNKKAGDPFGSDDGDFFDDDEPGESNVGRWIAIGVSGVMGLAIIGFVVIVILTADETAGPVTGLIPTEISEVVSEDGEVLQRFDVTENADGAIAPADSSADGESVVALPPLTSQPADDGAVGGIAMPDRSTVLSDTTAATDRSAARRPWLTTESTGGERAGQPQTEVTPRQTSGRQGMNDLLRQAREGQPPPRRTEPTLQPEPPESFTAMTLNERDETVAPTQLVPQEADDPEGLEEDQVAESAALAAPRLPEPGLVPGAPRRVLQDPSTGGPAAVGGAPRLSEPVLPPTDSRAISAAPPRFTTLPKAEELAALPDAQARVAIIVEGLGLNRSATEAAIESLPSSVTLSFSPYARDLQEWLEKATEAGHEVLVEVPMESRRFPADDPGPLGLLTSLDQIANVERLSTILDEAEGTAGIMDVTGSRFRESAEHINIVMNNLDARGLFYVQGRPGLRLGSTKVPSATADIVLDERGFRASIDARLDYVERLAKYQGSSVAVASAKPVTFERIALWLDEAGRRGVSVAPVSQVLIQ